MQLLLIKEQHFIWCQHSISIQINASEPTRFVKNKIYEIQFNLKAEEDRVNSILKVKHGTGSSINLKVFFRKKRKTKE